MNAHKTQENTVNSLETPAKSINAQIRASMKVKRQGSYHVILLGDTIMYRHSQRVFCKEWIDENYPVE